MEFVKKTIKVGNSAGVLLPKKLLGSEVKITVVKRPVNLKKKIMRAINQDLPDIFGVYLVNREPAEIIVVSNNIRKILESEKIKISFVPLSIINNDVKTKLNLRAKIIKAEPIMNRVLLNELKEKIRSHNL